jgi:hypothetical protein
VWRPYRDPVTRLPHAVESQTFLCHPIVAVAQPPLAPADSPLARRPRGRLLGNQVLLDPFGDPMDPRTQDDQDLRHRAYSHQHQTLHQANLRTPPHQPHAPNTASSSEDTHPLCSHQCARKSRTHRSVSVGACVSYNVPPYWVLSAAMRCHTSQTATHAHQRATCHSLLGHNFRTPTPSPTLRAVRCRASYSDPQPDPT